MTLDYDDIIHLPHHVSKRHPQMSMEARAAQFAPFSALTGYSSALRETARLTNEQISLDENSIEELNRQMMTLQSKSEESPFVSITYYQPDKKKKGGSYQLAEGKLKKIDESRQHIHLDDGTCIAFQTIMEIEIKDQDT
ncbi:MAG: hypothetical protein J5661_00115 [Bacteroidaceae bacterium]|nr:hypothetical protein [Bacteroidaceae bacterium]